MADNARRFRVTVYCSDQGAPEYDYDSEYAPSPEIAIAKLCNRCGIYARKPTRFSVTDTETMERWEVRA